MNETEEKIQEKTTVSTQPWKKYVTISQDNVYWNGRNWDRKPRQGITGISTDTFLTARIDKKTGNVDYYITLDMLASGNAFQHMEYTDSGVKKYLNVTNVDNETQCSGSNVYMPGSVGDITPSCNYETKSAVIVNEDFVENISKSSTPFEFVLVSDDPQILPFHDIITPSEAHALLDRVQQEKANIATSTEAQPGMQPSTQPQ